MLLEITVTTEHYVAEATRLSVSACVIMSSRLRLVQADFGAGKVGIESTSVSAGFRAVGRRAELLGGEKLGGRIGCVPSVVLSQCGWQLAGVERHAGRLGVASLVCSMRRFRGGRMGSG